MRHLVPVLALAAATATTAATAADAIPVPVQSQAKGVLLVAVIPDLKATLGRVEAAAGTLMPGSLPAGMLAMQAGMAFGDPGLTKLAAKPIVIVVAAGTPMPTVVGLVPSTDAAGYAQSAGMMQLMGAAEGDLAIIGKLPTDLDLGKQIAKDYATLTAGVTGDVRLTIGFDKVSTTYGPMLSGLMRMGMANAQPDSKSWAAMTMASGMIPALFMVMQDAGTMQVDLALKGEVLSIDNVLAPASGSALAKALVAPAAGGLPAVPAEGFLALTAKYPAKAFEAYLVDVVARLAKDPEGKVLADDQMVALLREQAGLATGNVAMAMGGTETLAQVGVMGHSDADKLKALQKKWLAVMTQGSLGKLYAGMGITSTLAENVRTSGGAQVSRIDMRIDPEKNPQAEAMQGMMRPVEMAVTKDLAVWANEPAMLDAAITGRSTAAPLAAQKVFPGMDGYADIEVIQYMQVTMAMQAKANPFMAGMFEGIKALKPAPPIVTAWRTVGGLAQVRTQVPLKGFFAIAQAMMGGMGGGPRQQAPGVF
jgi:hypothetical protein